MICKKILKNFTGTAGFYAASDVCKIVVGACFIFVKKYLSFFEESGCKAGGFVLEYFQRLYCRKEV